MKKTKAVIAIAAAIAVILGAFTIFSFAGSAPFGFFDAPVEKSLSAEPKSPTEKETTTDTASRIVPESLSETEAAQNTAEKNEPESATAAEVPESSAPVAPQNSEKPAEVETKANEVPTFVSPAAENAGQTAGGSGTQEPGNTELFVDELTDAEEKTEKPEEKSQTEPKTRFFASAQADVPSALNADIKGSLSFASEVKSYSFTLSARGALRCVFTHPATDTTAVWVVSLYQKYNANGFDGEEKWRLLNVLETAAANGADCSPFIGLQKGEYRITVEAGQKFSAASYILKAELTSGTSYEIEYNDTMARYTEICPGVPVKGSACHIKGSYDTDYYMFRLLSPGKISIRFEHSRIDTLSVYWRVALFNENGTELYSDNSLGSSELLCGGETGLEPGCYFIGVFGRVYTDVEYTLTVEREYTESFETEPNGTFAAADIFGLNNHISGALTSSSGEADTDVFEIPVSQPGYITLRFTVEQNSEENRCWRLLFCDASGKRIRECTVSPQEGETKTAPIGVGTGSYYVTVENSSLYKNSSTYTLFNEFTPTTSWEREYNGSLAAATPITDGFGMNGTITDCEAEFDDDYFKLTLPSPAWLRVKLGHEAQSDDRNIFAVSLLDNSGKAVQLFDAQTGKAMVSETGSAVTSLKSYGNTENVTAEYALSAGTYYIRVTSGLFSSDIRYLLTYTTKTGG